MGGLLLRLRTWWETADRTQRAVTLFGGGFLILLLVGTFFFASRPKMAMVFGGLSPAEVGQVTEEIQKLGIPVDFDLQGNVLVPSEKVAEVRAKLAVSGKLPTSGHLGNGDLSQITSFTTPAVERERLKAILEGELASSVEAIQGVQKARVHIQVGERSAFADESKPASASIFLNEQPGTSLSPDTAQAVAMLVSNAVQGLDRKNVFVLDSTGRSLYDGTQASGTGGMYTQKMQAEVTETQRRERELQGIFDTAYGHGNTVVKVNLEMDFDERSVQSVTPTLSEKPVVKTSGSETMSGNGSGPNGSGSTDANIPTDGGTGGATGTSSSQYNNTNNNSEYAVGESREQVKKQIGTIKTMSIAVLANQDKVDVNGVGAITDYLNGYLGAKATDRENFNSTVTAIKFDQTQATQAKAAAAEASSRDRMQQLVSLLPVLALMIVGFLVMKGVGKAAKAQTVMVNALPGGRVTAPTAPAGTAVATTGATQEEQPISAAAPALPKPEMTPEEIHAIAERLNKPLEQIKMMANDRPEAVAMLIKSWLLEERR